LAIAHEEQGSLIEKDPSLRGRQQRLRLVKQAQPVVNPAELAFRICQRHEYLAAKLVCAFLVWSVLELLQCGPEQPGTHRRMHVATGRDTLGVQGLSALKR
jgi:hypothetical protein